MFPEFVEMLSALAAEGADHIVVGGYAVGVYLEPRATKDFDILVRPTAVNAAKVLKALARFGAPLFGVTRKELATKGMVLQIGVPPRRIDIITSISGVDFDEAWRSRFEVPLEGLAAPMPVLGREALIKNKRTAARPQDLVDVANLMAAGKPARRRKKPRKA